MRRSTGHTVEVDPFIKSQLATRNEPWLYEVQIWLYEVQIWSRNTSDSGLDRTRVLHRVVCGCGRCREDNHLATDIMINSFRATPLSTLFGLSFCRPRCVPCLHDLCVLAVDKECVVAVDKGCVLSVDKGCVLAVCKGRVLALFFFFVFTLVTGPGRSLSRKQSDTTVYAP